MRKVRVVEARVWNADGGFGCGGGRWFFSVAGRFNTTALYHENNGALWCARAVHDSFRYRKPLFGSQFDRLILQLNNEFAIDDVEKLILLVVLVPVKLAFDDAESNDAVINLAQSLIKPLVSARIDELLQVNLR